MEVICDLRNGLEEVNSLSVGELGEKHTVATIDMSSIIRKNTYHQSITVYLYKKTWDRTNVIAARTVQRPTPVIYSSGGAPESILLTPLVSSCTSWLTSFVLLSMESTRLSSFRSSNSPFSGNIADAAIF